MRTLYFICITVNHMCATDGPRARSGPRHDLLGPAEVSSFDHSKNRSMTSKYQKKEQSKTQN